MTSTTEAGSGTRIRRTKAKVEEAITQAVLVELDAKGFAGLTFEAVARRAEVSKPVLYRRHSSRVSLVLSVLASTAKNLYGEAPMTGALRTDLQAWLGRAQEWLPRIQPATFRGLLGEANEEEMRQIAALLDQRMRDIERCVFEPARHRGEIQGDIPAPVARMFFMMLRDQALFGAQELDGTWMIDDVLLPLLKAHAHR
ncbi:MAG: TetR/AcrR family transcriptional regulator [Alphaproteobacteria bacterium]|nr:MAG: TetR/AcrR family transcriptional regulator [Alphaproteobacteria bacterium]